MSVCVPVFNGARYLAETLESVLAQDFDDFELLVCDDASTDETPAICRSYADRRVRYRRFEQRAGQAGNFNRCLVEARAGLVTLLHSDDVYLPGLLARRVAQLEQHPQAGFACGALELVDASGAPLSVLRPWSGERLLEPLALVETLLHGCVVSTLGLVLPRATAPEFREDLSWGHDWDWTLRLADRASAHYDSRPLARYRVHEASGTAAILSSATHAEQERDILEQALARVPAERRRALRRSAFDALSLRHMSFAEGCLLGGRRAAARYNLEHAARTRPAMLLKPSFWALLVASSGPLWVYRGFKALRSTVTEAGEPTRLA